MDSKKIIVSDQQNLKAQMRAVDLLAADFLTLMWSEKSTDYSTLKARYERHCSALEAAGHLLPQVVMHLFAKLEERAIYEINTVAVVAQASDVDGAALKFPNLPPEFISNVHAVHQHVSKTEKSKQARDAAKKKHKESSDKKELVLKEWDDTGHGYEGISDFARIVGQRDGIIVRTLCSWISKHKNTKR